MFKNINNTHIALRTHTKQAHLKLDQMDHFTRLMSKDVKLSEYVVCINKLGHWYNKYEYHIASSFPELACLAFIQAKKPLIDLDIQSIGQTPSKEGFSENLSSNLQDLSFALGILYVIEGSTLGGAAISPHIKRNLKRNDITRFYDCYGKDKFTYFCETMAFIHDYVNKHNCLHNVVAGALFAFADLHEWMETETRETVKLA